MFESNSIPTSQVGIIILLYSSLQLNGPLPAIFAAVDFAQFEKTLVVSLTVWTHIFDPFEIMNPHPLLFLLDITRLVQV